VKSQRLNKKESAKVKNGKSEQLFNNFSSWPLKMPTYRTEEEGEIDLLRANGGLAQASLYKRKNTEDNFVKFLSQSIPGHSFDDLILDTGELENQLIKFMALLEVTQKDKTQDLPKKNTLESIKSNLKSIILAKSKGTIDISNKVRIIFSL
jgi:hypothetical protein